ncbi:MAG TPA: DNA topoisomerase IB, partial [Luteimonas sp.]|nr:DNA topoisomerase IB [Luteimonas sp.]
RAGRGFRYVDAAGRPLRDSSVLERIRSLAIPPAWTDVWICRSPRGHLQATGRDARGRKQYRYHRDWSRVRGRGKFDHVVRFGAALPRLRRRLRGDLRLQGFPPEKVSAIVVALLADTLARVGNSTYARSNGSFGLTTLRNRHVEFLRGGRVSFTYLGKGGARQQLLVDDARLARLVRRCRQLPGQQLFQYRDDAGVLQSLGSEQVNRYLRDAMDGAFTAKDFRTWGGTLEAFRHLATTPAPAKPESAAAASTCKAVVDAVASLLGNTPAVCRKSYIDPRVFEGWRRGQLAHFAEGARGERQWEHALLRFLRRHARDDG